MKSAPVEASSTAAADQAAVLKSWRDAVKEALSRHPHDVVKSARKLDYAIVNMRLDAGHRAFLAEFRAPLPGKVQAVLDARGPKIDLLCDCKKFPDEKACAHSFFVLSELKYHLDLPASPIAQYVQRIASNPDWLPILDVIDQLAKSIKPPAETVKPEVTRLIFRVDTDDRYGHDTPMRLVPVEQRPMKKGGGWTKGRELSWDQLLQQRNPSIDPYDQTVLEAARSVFYRRGHGYGRWLDFDEMAPIWQALAGHPRVYHQDDPAMPLSIESVQVGVKLTPIAGGTILKPTLGNKLLHEFDDYTIGEEFAIGILIDKGAVLIAPCTDFWAECVDENIFERLVIAPADESRVLDRLVGVQEQLNVSYDSGIAVESRPFSAPVVVQLRRNKPAGGSVALRVEGPAAKWLMPGSGASEMLQAENGRRIRYVRNLAEEQTRARQLATDLGLSQPAPTTWQWPIASDDDLVDFLQRLKARPEDDPRVVWDDEQGAAWEVVGEVAPASLELQVKTERDWFGLNGTVRIGGHEFKLIDLLTAIRTGSKHVRLGENQWAVITEEFRDRLRALDDLLQVHRGKIEFDISVTPMVAELLKDTTIQQAAKRWTQTVNRLETLKDFNPELPADLTAELRDYQVQGYKWLRKLAEFGIGACLADDMGLGKTVQAIAVLCDRKAIGPTLVLAPTSVCFNWIRELEKFAPSLTGILFRDTDRSEAVEKLGPGDVLICSYGLLRRHAEELQAKKWATLVVDEAQFLKNSATQTAQIARELEAGWKVALTGTPVENRLAELWSIFRIVAPGLFGSWERFRDRFASPIEKGHDSERQQALARTVRPLILRRSKKDVLKELPQRTEIVLTAELSAPERQLYEDARLWAAAQLADLQVEGDNTARFQVLAMITRLRQLACHPRLVNKDWKESSAKLNLLMETLDELRDGGHRALVFSQFVQHLTIVREALDARGITYQYLDGETPSAEREAAVDRFQSGMGDVFLISLRAGGTGLNLTAADYVLHLDPWWNPAVEDQASDRAHRIGQTRPVTIYRFVAKETIEEQILGLHAEKRRLVSDVLDGSDSAARLSTRELVDLIKDGRKATAPAAPSEDL